MRSRSERFPAGLQRSKTPAAIRLLALIGLVVAIFAAACGAADVPGETTPAPAGLATSKPPLPGSTQDPSVLPKGPDGYTVPALIESVEIERLAAKPPNASLIVVSGLRSGCESFGGYSLDREGDVIHLEVTNRKPDLDCPATYTAVTTSILLGQPGYSDIEPCKTYTVVANGDPLSVQASCPAIEASINYPNNYPNSLGVTYVEGQFKSGSIAGKEITVPEGASVGVHVVLDAAGNTSGELRVEVWKHIALSPDVSYRTCEGAATLVKGTQAVYSCDFAPEGLANRRFTHYYLKAYWNGAPLTVEPRIGEGVRTVPGHATPTSTPSPAREWDLEGIQVDGSTVTVLLRVYAGIDVRATLDGTPADEVRHILPILEYVFLNVTPGQHTVEVQDVVGHGVQAEVVVATSSAIPDEDPEGLGQLVPRPQSEPVANPPLSTTRYGYQGQTVYFVPQRCCGIFSDLYDAEGNIVGQSHGGITGRGV